MIQLGVGFVLGLFVGAVAAILAQILIEDWQERKRRRK